MSRCLRIVRALFIIGVIGALMGPALYELFTNQSQIEAKM
jgi:hypothetical protein